MQENMLPPAGLLGRNAQTIKEGDLVVVYERFDSMKAVTVTPKGQFGNCFGNFQTKVLQSAALHQRFAWAPTHPQ